MNISVSEAAKRWKVSRTTIYRKVDDGELSRGADKKIDTAEMLRVFGNPPNTERTEQNNKNVHRTPVNSDSVQENVQLKHQLEMEKLKNVHLQQQVDHHKQLVESYQKQIEQLSKSLDKANASIQDFAQTKLLEMKSSLSTDSQTQHQTEPKTEDTPVDRHQKPKPPKEPAASQLDTKNESKRRWLSWLK